MTKEQINEAALRLHESCKGKITTVSTCKVTNAQELSLAYTPGVAEPCRKISGDAGLAYRYTMKGNMCAVISDGSAVLGLGNIGAAAALPVMEGKCVLFREFGGVNAFPICLDTQDTDEIVRTCINIAPVFGGINLEDISAPRCFEVERRLRAALNIPVFHDDQHGTAVTVAAGLINACRLTGKELSRLTVVVNGIGAAGTAIAKMLLSFGVKDMFLVDSRGIIYSGRGEGMNWAKDELAEVTNRAMRKGGLADALVGADVFIGVSKANILTAEMIKLMAKDPIVFALANPDPECSAETARSAGVAVMGTGRSDLPNQVNNVLAFPGIFRGAFNVRASAITESMKLAAAHAIASLVSPEELRADYILPKPFDGRVCPAVAAAVAKAAVADGVARS